MRTIKRIVKIHQINGFKIYCLFNNGESRVINFEELFKKWKTTPKSLHFPIANSLKEFKKVELIDGTLTWKNIVVEGEDENGNKVNCHYELDPIVLYEQSQLDTIRMKHIIVIDDTGSPGDFRETRFLKENRKSLIGVFIHSNIRELLELRINKFISTLNSNFGITEIHLTDLVNRKNEYSLISREDSLTIIMLLSKLFSNNQLPFIVQTCNDQTFKENGIPLKGKSDNFDFEKGEDQALFLLITHIREFMSEHYPNEEV